ncbi:MAG TPA: hypothetical protein EYF96_08080 [Nitrospinaceae bacterium]|jgi:hypothetical protein|nr:hypothetical protein [Nitrospinaceae bacterium]
MSRECRLLTVKDIALGPIANEGKVKIVVGLVKNRFWLVVALSLFVGCTHESKGDIADLPTTDINKLNISKFEGSRSKSAQQTEASEGYASKLVDEDHPNVQEAVKIERTIDVPGEVKGKWKAVKFLIKNQKDEERNEMKTVTLGSSFELEDSGIQVTVGPFLPNFVMSQGAYTSNGNELINPAIQLVVEQNGKTLYTGWAFAKYPTMYAFEHEDYAIQLMDYIPIDVS